MADCNSTVIEEKRARDRSSRMAFATLGILAGATVLLLPTAAAGWGPSTTVSADDLFGNAYMWRSGASDSGTVLGAYVQSDGLHNLLFVRPYYPGLGWGTSSRLSSENRTVYNLDLKVSGDGNASLAWVEEDLTVPWSGVFSASYSPQNGWGSATLVAQNNGTLPSGYGDRIQFVWVGRSNAGATLVAWTEFVNVTNSLAIFRLASAGTSDGTNWTSASTLSASGPSVQGAKCSSSGGGSAVCLFTERDPWGSGSPPRTLFYSAGVGWNAAVQFGNGSAYVGSYPIGTDDAGNLRAVWLSGGPSTYYIYESTTTDGNWTAPTILITSHYAGDIQLDTARDGHAVLVWNEYYGSGTSVYAERFVPGTGWSLGRLIEPLAGYSYSLHPSIANGGNITVGWTQGTSQSCCTPSTTYANVYINGSGWLQPEAVSPVNITDAVSLFQMSSDGKAVGVWSEKIQDRFVIWGRAFDSNVSNRTPLIFIGSPADGQEINGASVPVSGEATPGSSVSVNGWSVLVGPDGTFSVTIGLPAGNSTITVSATLWDGPSASSSITIFSRPASSNSAQINALQSELTRANDGWNSTNATQSQLLASVGILNEQVGTARNETAAAREEVASLSNRTAQQEDQMSAVNQGLEDARHELAAARQLLIIIGAASAAVVGALLFDRYGRQRKGRGGKPSSGPFAAAASPADPPPQ